MVKWKFDDGSGWLENQTLMKKEQTIKKELKQQIWPIKTTSGQLYLLGLWYEDICIPYNVWYV